VKNIKSPSNELLGIGNEPDSTGILHELYQEQRQRANARAKRDKDANNSLASLNQAAVSRAYMQEMPRPWRVGDVYAARDLGPTEMRKLLSRHYKRVPVDVLDMLGIDPLESWKVSPLSRSKRGWSCTEC
jgi:hypothetical protein